MQGALTCNRCRREAAGLAGSETVRYQELSFSHRREHVEAIVGAKKPETRARRIANAVRLIVARPARQRS